MAAPSGIVWGSIAGGYGRIGIYTSLSSTNTTTTVSIEVWFWSKYGVVDSNNSYYFDNNATEATTEIGSVSLNHQSSSGSGWSESNQTKLGSYSYSYTRTTSAKTISCAAKLTNIDRVGAAMTVTTSYTIPKLASYTVSYNANGGSGAPSSQTKWYGTALTLSSTKPTRTGYSFQGWGTSASDTSVDYAAGASYTANAAITLYAIWKANTYTVSYNANGGSGAPGKQTKTYGVTLTLSSTKPTRTDYNFKGWATSASATTATYAAGASYTANASVTLYAVWELAYVKPIIYNLKATRCGSDGKESDTGAYAIVEFDWETTNAIPGITIAWQSASAPSGSKSTTTGGTSGTYRDIIGGSLSAESTYTITVTVRDSGGASDASTTLNGAKFPIDAKAGGTGVSFGKPAELGKEDSLGGIGVADFAFDAKFNQPVYGKALGMDRLPAIPADSDFNSYIEPGCYAVYSNAAAATIANIPVDRAGRLEVWSATGEGVRAEQWSYLRQRFIPYNRSNAVWEREVTRGEDNVWNYYEWWESSLTPDASEKVYAKAAMTISLSANAVLGTVNTYTTVPLNTEVLSTSGRLTLQSNSIRIGKNIQYVKVSAQVLTKCGSTDGNRHLRIIKTSKSVAWSCSYGLSTRNLMLTLAPVIVSVGEGDTLSVAYYTSDAADSIASGSAANGWQTYLTVEEL